MKTPKIALNRQKMEIIGGILLLAIFVLPFLTFASSRKDIYVDGLKSGVESGTAANPYHTISEALKHANNRTDVHVAKGEYKDNIEIPKGVKIFGSGQGEVVITAKNDRKVVVSMKDNTEINKLTIQEGREGVWIKEDARVSIIKCTIKDNRKDGINIASGSTKKADAVSITDSTIKNNGRSGIFSQKRRLVLINNEVIENDSDGADFAAGTSAWIEDNKFNDNDGSGLKLNFDNSNIWTKGNDYRDNKHSGLEVNAFGGAGRIDINKSNFIENKNFGIARIARGNVSINVWEGLTVQSNTTFEMTKIGKISSIIQVR